ncbi:MAG: YbbR-like domain-containing protein [Candidatus Omnitrophica bacterium]|nr:YbbR-like domain-containing protein [Candidatus Omnitrophota bacterium]
MKKIIIKNLWLKVLALFLAVIVWLYVVGELNKGTPNQRALFERILPYRIEAREVPIKIALIGKPLNGYRVLHEKATVKPSTCIIMAPKNVLKNISHVATEDIDIGEFTKSVVKQIKVKPIGGGVIVKGNFFVTVAIPIEKIERKKEVAQ